MGDVSYYYLSLFTINPIEFSEIQMSHMAYQNYEMEECLLENRQIIQVRNIQQARPLDWRAKQVSEESQPKGVQYDVQAVQDVWDGSRVQEWG